MTTLDVQAGIKYWYEHRNNFNLMRATQDYKNTYVTPRNLAAQLLIPDPVAVAGHELASGLGWSQQLAGWV